MDITIPSQSYLYEDSGFSIDISAWPEYAVHESALIFTQHGQLKYYEINEAPVVLDSTIVLSEDEAYLAALDIENLENDTLDYSITEQPSNGELTISEAGEVHYMPKVNFNGKDAFTLRVVDPYGGDDTRSINIIVASVNDLPEAKDSVHSVTTGATLTGQVIAEDVDNIASELSYEVVTNVTQGQLSLSSDGNFSYVANAGFVGEDFFVFKAKDPEQGETEGTAKITVKTKVIKEASKEGSSGGSLGYIAIVAFSLIFIRPRRQFQKH